MATNRRRVAILVVALMVILAGGITGIYLGDGDDEPKRDPEDLPDATPGGRYDPR